MSICGSCFGSGNVSCFSCHGKGYIGRLTMNGEFEMNTCLVCGGSRHVRCSFCGGTGKIGPDIVRLQPAPKVAKRRSKSSDALEGRWNTQGGYWEFKKEKTGYSVIETGVIGKTGEGRATLKGNAVVVEMNNVILGNYPIELKLGEDRLEGKITVFGIPTPLIYYRA